MFWVQETVIGLELIIQQGPQAYARVQSSFNRPFININPSQRDHCIKFELTRMNHKHPPLTYELSRDQTIHQAIIVKHINKRSAPFT